MLLVSYFLLLTPTNNHQRTRPLIIISVQASKRSLFDHPTNTSKANQQNNYNCYYFYFYYLASISLTRSDMHTNANHCVLVNAPLAAPSIGRLEFEAEVLTVRLAIQTSETRDA